MLDQHMNHDTIDEIGHILEPNQSKKIKNGFLTRDKSLSPVSGKFFSARALIFVNSGFVKHGGHI